jgi:hypothetical protein
MLCRWAALDTAPGSTLPNREEEEELESVCPLWEEEEVANGYKPVPTIKKVTYY